MEEQELTRGMKAVGASFSPSRLESVDKAKMLIAQAIDVLLEDFDAKAKEKAPDWETNVFRTEAYTQAVNASSAIVKFLTWGK